MVLRNLEKTFEPKQTSQFFDASALVFEKDDGTWFIKVWSLKRAETLRQMLKSCIEIDFCLNEEGDERGWWLIEEHYKRAVVRADSLVEAIVRFILHDAERCKQLASAMEITLKELPYWVKNNVEAFTNLEISAVELIFSIREQ